MIFNSYRDVLITPILLFDALGEVIEETQELTGREIERANVDKGYGGHNASKPLRVFISGQKRGVFGTIKRELRRRSGIEPHVPDPGHVP